MAQPQVNSINKIVGLIGDSELRGCVTRWYWSQAGLTPIEDWTFDERRGHELGAVMAYLSNGQLRYRVNTAWGGTTARDWATNGLLSGRNNATVNSVNADRGRALRWKPGVVLICVGMNDATDVRGASLLPSEHVSYLDTIVKSVRAAGSVPFVLLAPPRDDASATIFRDRDGLTITQALDQIVALDETYCLANKVSYLNTRELFGRSDSPSSWIPGLRYDGVHFHAPSALKLLAKTLLARPEIQAIFQPPINIAESAPSNGQEFRNLIQYACFQGGLDAKGQRPVGWEVNPESLDSACKVTVSLPANNQLGKVLNLTRTRGSDSVKKISQTITRGFTVNGVMRFSGMFRASGFLDQFWHAPANGSGTDVSRCAYSLSVAFLDSAGTEISNTRIAPCDVWSIDTDGAFWRFYQDFVVPPKTASLLVQIQNAGDLGLSNQNAKLEVSNLSLRYLGPAGRGRIYP
jgi:lysophospholipase L1-like esterase